MEIRQLEENKNIPKEERVNVIIMTSHTSKDQVVGCLEAGCNDFMVKPVNFDSIQAKLKEYGFEG